MKSRSKVIFATIAAVVIIAISLIIYFTATGKMGNNILPFGKSTITDGAFLIKYTDSNKVLQLSVGDGGEIGVLTQTDEKPKSNTQTWLVSSTGDGYFKINSALGKYCLQVKPNGAGNNILTMGSFENADHQKWEISNVLGGVKIVSKSTGLAIGFPKDTKKDSDVDIEEYKGKSLGQVYTLVEKETVPQKELDAYIQNAADNASPVLPTISEPWTATDMLGRTLPTYEEVGDTKLGKYVGMFYWTWHGDFAGSKVYDTTKSIMEAPNMDDFKLESMQEYWWAQPEAGYYNGTDVYVHYRNLIMMANAGVDFIYLDYTNGVWHEGIKALFMAYDMVKANGYNAPKFVFFLNASPEKILVKAYNEIYKKDLYKDYWFIWDGKPLVMSPDSAATTDVMKDFFTFRRTWAFDMDSSKRWNFVDEYPQQYGYKENPLIPEQIIVTKAMGAPLVMNNKINNKGSSYNWAYPEIPPVYNERLYTEDTFKGIAFDNYWKRALEVNPLIVCVTGWNEWVARNWDADQSIADNYTFMGKPIALKGASMVDEFNIEYNRDIEPMKGGYSDSYYYQLVSYVRKFKGMQKPTQTAVNATISIDGNFDDWNDIKASFTDNKGDTLFRNAASYIKKDKLINETGRNDFVETKAAYDKDNLYFQITTAANITPYTDTDWMLIYLDTDINHNTGWEGYDYVVNRSVISDSKTTLMKWTGTAWEDTAIQLDYKVSANQLEISILQRSIGVDVSKKLIYFKLADNVQGADNLENFFINGDTSPDRRFNYVIRR